MLSIDFSRHAAKTIKSLMPKHARQISEAISGLRLLPFPHDAQRLKGTFSAYWRVTVGEYRIIYYVEAEILFIVAIGKRNDDEVYKQLKRLG